MMPWDVRGDIARAFVRHENIVTYLLEMARIRKTTPAPMKDKYAGLIAAPNTTPKPMKHTPKP